MKRIARWALIFHKLKEMSMTKMQISAIALSALVVVPVQASLAQSPQVAYASESRPRYVVFFNKALQLRLSAMQRWMLTGPPASFV
jgi:hypothetical protein